MTVLPEIPRHYVNVDSAEKLALFIEAVKYSPCKYMSFDTETTGLGRLDTVFGFVVCLGDAAELDDNGNQKPKTVYWYRFDKNSDMMNSEAVRLIQWIFSQCDKIVIFHNMIFDIRMVRQTWNIVWDGPKYNDTYIMAEVLRRHPRSGLKELGARVLKQNDRWDLIVKDWFKTNKYTMSNYRYQDVPDELMFPYAATDAELTYRLFFALRDEFGLEPACLQDIYKLEKEVIPVTAEMEFNGMVVSLPYFRQLAMKVDQLLNDLLEYFMRLWGPDFNPKSTPQLRRALYGTDKNLNQLGLIPMKLTPSGAASTDVHALESYADHEVVSKLLTYSRLYKMQTSFIQAILLNSLETEAETWTIHTSYRQILDTGRYSSSRMNLQQIPNDNFSRGHGQLSDGSEVSIRRGFIAPDDMVYCKFDYAAFELRLLGNASKDQLFIDMVQDDVDMHSWLAAVLYRDDLDNMDFSSDLLDGWQAKTELPLSKKWKLDWKYWAVKSKATKELKYMRTMVKVCSFEIYYGAGPRKIALTHSIPIGLAEHLRHICYSTFEGVKSWRNLIVHQAQQSHRVYTLFGRQRKLDPDKIYTTAVNTIIQGTAADILKLAMVDIYALLKGKQSKLIATIHDEVQVYVHKDELYLIPEIIACMEKRRLPREDFPLDMLCEASMTTKNWSSMRDLHQRGEGLMQEIKTIIEEESNEA